ncbi:hypothetical protein [Aliikangiella sp. IMCC44359]|uniref:hypothetical protein n=1 Tax=Aliikangiella sp. IMCC44359 TaxID=3459125 RepID=UPI00403AB032
MSILLESLTQKSNSGDTATEQEKVPDIHAAHFDDELMGDDWLRRRLKVWQLLSAALSVALITSWVFFYFLQVDEPPVVKASIVDKAQANTDDEIKSTQKINTTNTNIENDAQVNGSDVIVSDTTDDNSINKSIYKPTKRTKPAPSSVSQKPASTNPMTAVENVSKVDAQTKKNMPVITQAELSDELKSQFPNLVIDSYVVAATPADSFVILDGSFYKLNQVIAPDLILRDISKQHIVVEFHSQLVKVPLK